MLKVINARAKRERKSKRKRESTQLHAVSFFLHRCLGNKRPDYAIDCNKSAALYAANIVQNITHTPWLTQRKGAIYNMLLGCDSLIHLIHFLCQLE